MAKNSMRKLTPDELALVCGGSSMSTVDLPRMPVHPDPEPVYASYDYPDWPDNYGPNFYDDPYDNYGDNDGGGGGGDSTTSTDEMRDYLEGNSEFNELSDKLKQIILGNDKLTTALNDMLKQGYKFEATNITSYTLGKTIFVNDGALAGNEPNDSKLNMFFHEIGHFVHGTPERNAFADPNAYAQARAQSEVNADMFTVQISKEVGITYYILGTLELEQANKVANGTFTSSDYQSAVNSNLLEKPGVAAYAPADLNADGKVDNRDLYLDQWISPTGQTYSQWLQSQSSGGTGNGNGPGNGPGNGGQDQPHNTVIR